ncbi:ABC transporter ATP-binding protein [Achromobacter veterisilvae]|uniref:ABC transporter ATP-binding protein n=1 Tax=Achromobacter veterisilvae TaxID=2069367 RepID=A0ABZ2S127_9BURK
MDRSLKMSLSIQVENLRKNYKLGKLEPRLESPGDETEAVQEKAAVDGVSLKIGMGERLGIVGRNGAGKSTLLHMIAGLSSPTSGSITVNGKVTAIMTLGLGLREHASGRENVYIDGEVQGKTKAEIDAVIGEIIDFAELGEFIDFPVRTYSTGMKSRLAFAMISYLEPEILIIDEALSAGDAKFSQKATAKIREICAKGKIVIIVSHSMSAINDMCNRCLWIDQGRIVMDGTPKEVCDAYIDAVRGEDEARLLERFKSQALERVATSGWDIETLALRQGGTAAERVLIEAGEDLAIRTKILAPHAAAETVVGLSVTRLDGLVVLQEDTRVDAYRENGVVRVQFGMLPVVLGQGVYRLEISAREGVTVRARRSMIFEVYTQTPPSGGKPLLLYPAQASASTLSGN